MLLLIICAVYGGLAGYGIGISAGLAFPLLLAILMSTMGMAAAGFYLARARASGEPSQKPSKDKQDNRKSFA